MELLIYILKSAGILSIFYLVYISVLRNDTFFNVNRHFLIGGILAALVFPFLVFSTTTYIEVPIRELSPITSSAALSEYSTTQQAASASINWWEIGLLIYGIGVLFMSLRFIRQLVSLLTLLKTSPSVKQGKHTYIKVDYDCLPFSFFNYIVYNPQTHSNEDLDIILKHEQVHASQWHSLDIILTNILLIFQWMNPLAWLYKKGIEQNLEFIADNEAAQHVSSVKQYQLTLVKASSNQLITALTTNFYQSFIKKRIIMLNKSTSKRINIWKPTIVLPLLALFLFSFNVKEIIEYKELPILETEAESIVFSSESTTKEASKEGEFPLAIASETTNLAVVSTSEKTTPSEAISEKINATISAQDIVVTITKNTTKEQLDDMKKELKAQGLTFDYSNLSFNAENEITAISIAYTDSNNNSGNYSVNSENPINTIVIRSTADGISVRSAGNGDYSYSSEEQEIRRGQLAERRAQLAERREEMNEQRKEMREEMHETRKQLREEMRERHEEHEDGEEHEHEEEIEAHYARASERHARAEARMKERHKEMEKRHEKMEKRHMARISQRGHGNTTSVHMENGQHSDHHIVIDKNTSDSALAEMKRDLAEQNIDFSYKRVKRNNAGELTGIKITVDNNKGSKTVTNVSDDKPIDKLVIKI